MKTGINPCSKEFEVRLQTPLVVGESPPVVQRRLKRSRNRATATHLQLALGAPPPPLQPWPWADAPASATARTNRPCVSEMHESSSLAMARPHRRYRCTRSSRGERKPTSPTKPLPEPSSWHRRQARSSSSNANCSNQTHSPPGSCRSVRRTIQNPCGWTNGVMLLSRLSNEGIPEPTRLVGPHPRHSRAVARQIRLATASAHRSFMAASQPASSPVRLRQHPPQHQDQHRDAPCREDAQ